MDFKSESNSKRENYFHVYFDKLSLAWLDRFFHCKKRFGHARLYKAVFE